MTLGRTNLIGSPMGVGAMTGGTARVGLQAETAAFGEILINATHGNALLNAFTLAGDSNLDGKILAELSNAFDFRPGQPPMRSIGNTDSAHVSACESRQVVQYADSKYIDQPKVSSQWESYFVHLRK